MHFVDTHCHIHDANYPLDIGDTIRRAHDAGVGQMICVGTSEESSRRAVNFSAQHQGLYASIGVHPHDTKEGWQQIAALASQQNSKVVAVGEIGLDYFYTHSPRDTQIRALEEQIDIAIRHNLPIIFHVREAFDDFWPIFDNFPGIRGVLHSFTDSTENMEKALKRSVFIGVNGISTFTKDMPQQEMFAQIPLEKMLLETDAPFLTPKPLRGKVNEPAFVKHVAEFHAAKRNVTLEEIAKQTTANARALFALS